MCKTYITDLLWGIRIEYLIFFLVGIQQILIGWLTDGWHTFSADLSCSIALTSVHVRAACFFQALSIIFHRCLVLGQYSVMHCRSAFHYYAAVHKSPSCITFIWQAFNTEMSFLPLAIFREPHRVQHTLSISPKE